MYFVETKDGLTRLYLMDVHTGEKELLMTKKAPPRLMFKIKKTKKPITIYIPSNVERIDYVP
ncbi:MAG: hypothetical protein Q6356_003210 [Candidatus Wukongarchaeota archaeon]|nr:hypothetical protein [Candidatus Wukongarchaeota archaeon]